MIDARGLEARYRGLVALTGLDLAVAPGEIIGVLGPNGAGKSTLLRLLATGRRPAAGSLLLFGQDAGRPTTALRRRIGIVGDESIHIEALTGRENATLFARAAGLAPRQARARADALLSRFQLDADAGRPVSDYSLGMRRRLDLVEALAHEPALLVLDEPQAGLDPPGKELLREVLRERAARGVTVVLASHDVADAEVQCDRVLFLRGGRKVLEGVPAELIARLGGTTRFELRLRAPHAPDVRCEGVTISIATAEKLVAHSANGSSPLPALCDAVLRAGAAIEAVAVTRPGLGDVFLRATGEELEPMVG